MPDSNDHESAKIRVRHLTKVFGPDPDVALAAIREQRSARHIHETTGHVAAVRDASFDVREGEIFIVMGLSGSGKSTLVRMLNRLIEPTQGQVFIGDDNILEMDRQQLIDLRRRDIAMVFQHFALMPHLDNFDNVAFGLDVAGVKEPQRSERVRRALETVGLGDFAHSHPHELSGGMQQRVGLARALSLDPGIMLLDEAFSALDPLIRTEMQDELLKIHRDHGITIVFISHDLREALRIGDRLAIMQAGRIVQVGTPRELILQPANDYVRSFLYDVDKRQVLTAQDLATAPPVSFTASRETTPSAALDLLARQGGHYVYVINEAGHYLGVASRDSLQRAVEAGEPGLDGACIRGVPPLRPDQGFYDMVTAAVESPCPLPVIDRAGALLGIVPHTAMLKTLQTDTAPLHG